MKKILFILPFLSSGLYFWQMTNKPYLWAAFLAFTGAIFHSTKAILVKVAYQYEIDSVSLLALRMLFSIPLYLLIYWFLWKRSINQPPIARRDWVGIAVIGITGFYVASLLSFIGLQYISASLERLILYVYPTLVLLLSAVVFRKKITKIQWVSLLMVYVGILVVFLAKIDPVGNPNPLLGGVLVFGAALTYAIYLVGSGQLLPRVGTLRFTVFSMIAACIAALLHSGWANQLQLFHFRQEAYLIILLIAIFSTVLPSFMVIESIRIIGANNAAIIGTIGPISTIIMAYFFLGERLYWQQWLGSVIVIGGVLLISLRKGG